MKKPAKIEIYTYYKISVDVMFEKIPEKRGINHFGGKSVADIIKEFNQLERSSTDWSNVMNRIRQKDKDYGNSYFFQVEKRWHNQREDTRQQK